MAKTSYQRDATKLTAYLSPYNSGFYFEWTERADFVVRSVSNASGMTPGQAVLTARTDPNAATNQHDAIPGENIYMKLPNGETGNTLGPFYVVYPFDFIKIEANENGTTTTVFIGMISNWEYKRQQNEHEITALDFRWLLNRIHCIGSRWRRPGHNDSVFIPDFGPNFGEDGQANMGRGADGTSLATFSTVNYNRDIDGQTDEAVEYSDFWTCGDALNCLRDIFYSDVPEDPDNSGTYLLPDVSKFMEWDAASDGTDGQPNWLYLYEFQDSNDDTQPNVLSRLDCSGQSLAWAIDRIISASGPHDWTLTYTGSSGNEKAVLKVYEIDKPLADADGDLVMGNANSDLSDAIPDVWDCDLSWDWTNSYSKVRAVGAKRTMDVTLKYEDGAATPQLSAQWDATEQSAFLAAAAEDQNSYKYDSVLRRYSVDDDFDWSAFFTNADFGANLSKAHREGARRVFRELATQAYAEASENDDIKRGVNLPVQLWRDTGSGLEFPPDSVGVTPLSDQVGIKLSGSARKQKWNWDDTPTLYDIYATLQIEHDQRVYAEATDEDISSYYGMGELYLSAGPKYKYSRQSNSARVTVDGSGNPSLDGTTSDTFSATVVDDTDSLQGLAARRLLQVARPMVSGTIILGGIRPDIEPGYIIGQLTGGDNTPNITLGVAVRTVAHNQAEQKTILTLEAV